MQAAERARLIARYREGPDVLEAALAGITAEELDRRPGRNSWSPREVVHHTADSEITSAIRLRRLLCEEQPEIQGYDEMEFSRRLFYRERPIAPSLAAVRAARATTADILDRLDEGDWERGGMHAETGRYGVQDWLRIYAEHCHEHADQIRRSRAGRR
ncbi:MAG TPA: DinB family protein [Candidatus Dormibacteraeota bacterium]